MDETEKVLKYIYQHIKVINPLSLYMFKVWRNINQNDGITEEEYKSIIWSYEFNTRGK